MKRALYFGCADSGHYLHIGHGRRTIDPKRAIPGFPWEIGHLDTGLLTNGKRPDICDGKVFWTCGDADDFWFAFYWWDRSGDSRPNSSSGFYVCGFPFEERDAAFAYAREQFPNIVKRQRAPLVLQSK